MVSRRASFSFGRLSRLKDAINSGILTEILRNTNKLNVQTLDRLEKSDQEAQLILKAVLESMQANNRDVMAAVAQLASRMEIFQQENQNNSRATFMRQNRFDPAMFVLNEKSRAEEVFALSQWKEEKLRSFVKNGILRHLNYAMLPKWYEAVVEAHPKTFEWALQDSKSCDLSSVDLSAWLRHESGLYWISGKSGSVGSLDQWEVWISGKSGSTKALLEKWARQDEDSTGRLIMANFFFWNSGTLEQRSQIGMLRALLFQVFEQMPELLPIVIPSLWLKQYGKYLANGPHVNLVPNTKSSVKICVSSRPYVVFQENFEGCPMLQVQDLTLRDITQFVSDRFLGNGAFKKLIAQEPLATSQLVDAVVSKSDGIFLWVFIVVKDLLRGIRNRDTIPGLWQRLDALPRELEPLYLRIMAEIDPIYLVWTSKTFQLIRTAREVVVPKAFNVTKQGFLTIAELYFALSEPRSNASAKQLTQKELEDICDQTEYHIAARCACFLEVTKDLRISEGQVQYLHRTAKDFLEEPSRWANILDHTRNAEFDSSWAMLQSKSLLVHRVLGRKRQQEKDTIGDTFIIMLALAMRIDGHSTFYKDRMPVLDDAEELLGKYHIDLQNQVNFDTWYADEPHVKFPQIIKSSLLACALALDFTEYVDLRLSALNAKDPAAGKLAATLMIRGLATGCDWTDAVDLAPVKLHTQMATILVQRGADLNATMPNQALNMTLWRYLLSYRAFVELSEGRKTLDPAFPKFMSTALAFGADPNMAVGIHSLSLTNMIECYVRPDYPVDADRLLVDIINARTVNR
ncbi:hypothetical protein BKA65DRAFT_483931 [Rhexocercosporidium sp. MPI-PUGE-AT-0058]|nr:hypothetical protein BKA65DRAFT_483931 [Rhexocercosporidium sp. MPI-PUGE-AT-0058]